MGALAYGGGAWGIADKMNMTLDAAKELLKNYFKAFPGIKKYIENCQAFVDEHGYIIDMFGRSRRFKYAGYADPDKRGHYEKGDREGEIAMFWNGLGRVKDSFRQEVGGDRRGATNFPIQAAAATMTKVAGNNVYRMLLEQKLDAELIEFIHDELLITCRKDEHTIKAVIDIVKRAMVTELNISSFCIGKDKHPLEWEWPTYLDMDFDLKVGDSYGTLLRPEKYLAALAA